MNPTTIAAMPKVELHVHIEGTLEPPLIRQLASRNNLPVPPRLHTRTEGYDFHDLDSFLEIYLANIAILQTQQDFYDMTWAYLETCKAQNVVHAEIFFDPQAHTTRGIPFASVINGLHDAVTKADSQLGVSALLIMCFMRDLDADSAAQTLADAAPYKHLITGVGLDSAGADNLPNKFAHVFKQAREQGYKLTCHCDVDEPNATEHIRQAIHDIGVDRIDHGENALDDPALVDALLDKRIGLTCCPVSNAIIGDSKADEILELLHKGVLVTLNSDDPSYFRANLTDNIVKFCGVSSSRRSDIVKMQRNAFNISWLPPEKFQRLIGTFNQWIISIELAG